MKTKRAHIAIFPIAVLAAAIVAAAPAAAQQSMVWRDYFNDNSGKWLVGDTEGYKGEVSGGQYRITGKTGGRWVSYGLKINRDRDYSLEAKVRGDSSDPSNYVALIWDMKDGGTYLEFAVSLKGNFSVSRCSGGATTYLADWESNSAINKGATFNTLQVRRSGQRLVFAVNGVDVKSLPYQTFSGDHIAFSFSGAQTMYVDSVILSEAKIYEGEALAPSAAATVRYQDRFGDHKSSWLESSGSLKGAWDASSAADPGYTLEHGNRDYIDNVAKDLEFDLSRDFSIVAQIKFLSGDDDIDYGLVVDKSGSDFVEFALTGTGFFSITRYSSGKYTELVPWTESANVNCYESPNVLGVFRRGRRLLFAINGHKVHEMEFDGWVSTEAGFCSGGAMKLRPLSLAVYEEPAAAGPAFGDCAEGFGSWVYADGARYVGFWARGRPEGPGTMYKADGSVQEGTWKDGVFLREGILGAAIFYPVMTKSGDAGYMDTSGKVVSFGLKGVAAYDKPSFGAVPTAEDGAIGFRDAAGLKRSSPAWSLASGFSGRLAAIKSAAGGIGVVDSSGKVVVDPGKYQIDEMQDFSYGLVAVKAGSKDQARYGLLGADGSLVRKPDLLALSPFRGGLAAAKARNGKFGFIDRAGEWRVTPKYKSVNHFSEGLACVASSSGAQRFVDSRGKTAFVLDYDQYPCGNCQFGDGLLAFYKNLDDIGYLDREGFEAIAPDTWSSALPFSEGLAAVKASFRWGFMDKTGALVIDTDFDAVKSFSMGLAAAEKGNVWGYLNAQGEWAVAPAFADACDFRPEGIAQVKLPDGAWTWIDPSGKALWTEKVDASLILNDDFESGAGAWPLGEDASMAASRVSGRYFLKSKTQSGGIVAIPAPLDRGQDFSLAAIVSYSGTGMNDAIGLAWDLVDMGTFYALALTSQGNYAIAKFSAGAASFISAWAPSESIKKGSAANRLEIRRSGAVLEFLINGAKVKTIPYETMSGQGIGFACFGSASMYVDSVTLRQEK